MNVNEGLPPITLSTGRVIGPDSPCFVVAEIGQNHNGDVYTATRLMKAAHDAGVDAIKFCKRDIDSDLTKAAQDMPYVGPQSYGATYGDHRRALELSPKEYRHLFERQRYNQWPEIMFATACDIKSVDDIEATLNPPLYKVASRDLDNLPLIEHIARLNKPIILSTGMGWEWAIDDAIATIRRCHNQIVLLVCTSEYPTPPEHVGLRRLEHYRYKYNVLVGMSDHTTGIVAAQAAATLGACVIEKHITLSRAMKGTDHAASLEPDGIAKLVRNIRLVELMRASSQEEFEEMQAAIEHSIVKLGRSLVTKKPILKGEMIILEHLCLKSPGNGVKWRDMRAIVGKTAAIDLPADHTLQEAELI